MSFLGYKGQSALSFFKGRSSTFLHFYAVCSIMSRQEIFLYLTSVWLRFVFIRFYKASGFSNIFGYYCEYCLFLVKILFLFLCFSLFCKRCMCIYVSVILNWVCWVRGNFSGGLGHIFSVCVSPLCGVPGRYNFIRALSWSGWRDCTDFFFSLALL